MKTLITAAMVMCAGTAFGQYFGRNVSHEIYAVTPVDGTMPVSIAETTDVFLSGGLGSATNPVRTAEAASTNPSDAMIRDAFGRLRVSQPTKLFDSKQLNGPQPLFWDTYTSDGGAYNYQTNDAETILSIPAGTNGTVIRQTFMRMNYQPGNSQLFLFTGHLGTNVLPVGAVARAGYFTADFNSTDNPAGLWF